MKIEVHHPTGVLASWDSRHVPSVGNTISFIGEIFACVEVTRVDWSVYTVKESAVDTKVVAVVDLVRVFVK